jgi:hypothetical protein
VKEKKPTRALRCWACGEPFAERDRRVDRNFRYDGQLRGVVVHSHCYDRVVQHLSPEDLAGTAGRYKHEG